MAMLNVAIISISILAKINLADGHNSYVLKTVLPRCGLTRIRGGVAIVGGVVAGQHEFPWMVSLQIQTKKGTYQHFCGASIIAERWLLTAAHCFDKLNIHSPSVIHLLSIVTSVNLLSQSANGDRYHLEQIIVHEGYSNFNHDIALLRTRTPINFSRTNTAFRVNAICLPPYQNTNSLPYPPPDAFVTGWGQTESDVQQLSNQLLKVSVSHVTLNRCARLYNPFDLTITEKQLCYGRKKHDSCQGDSGGPLQKQANRRSYLIGIVSFGAGCGVYPGVYTNVVKYLTWIEAKVY